MLFAFSEVTTCGTVSKALQKSNGSSVCDIYSNSIHRGGESAQLKHSEHIGKGQTTEN